MDLRLALVQIFLWLWHALHEIARPFDVFLPICYYISISRRCSSWRKLIELAVSNVQRQNVIFIEISPTSRTLPGAAVCSSRA